MNDKLYYIQDTRCVVGNCAVWWRAKGQGYTCDLGDAGVYTEDEARSYTNRPSDKLRPKDETDALVVRHVRNEDMRELGARGGR